MMAITITRPLSAPAILLQDLKHVVSYLCKIVSTKFPCALFLHKHCQRHNGPTGIDKFYLIKYLNSINKIWQNVLSIV